MRLWRQLRLGGRGGMKGIAPLELKWVAFKELVRVESGKLKEIVEKRYQEI
jgi:hypothetical protein